MEQPEEINEIYRQIIFQPPLAGLFFDKPYFEWEQSYPKIIFQTTLFGLHSCILVFSSVRPLRKWQIHTSKSWLENMHALTVPTCHAITNDPPSWHELPEPHKCLSNHISTSSLKTSSRLNSPQHSAADLLGFFPCVFAAARTFCGGSIASGAGAGRFTGIGFGATGGAAAALRFAVFGRGSGGGSGGSGGGEAGATGGSVARVGGRAAGTASGDGGK